MRCVGFANGLPCPVAGQWLKSYDPEAHDGQGDAVFTDKIQEAWVFSSMTDALATWRAVPKARPFRPDGKPNRPLTTFTVEFSKL
jgi:hypothetical protein